MHSKASMGSRSLCLKCSDAARKGHGRELCLGDTVDARAQFQQVSLLASQSRGIGRSEPQSIGARNRCLTDPDMVSRNS